jgi:hypothetical protein
MENNLAELLAGHVWVIVLILLWTLPWKVVALWRSARRAQSGWFLAMIILNTLGILEIIYLAFFSQEQATPQPPAAETFRSRFESDQEKLEEKINKKIIM